MRIPASQPAGGSVGENVSKMNFEIDSDPIAVCISVADFGIQNHFEYNCEIGLLELLTYQDSLFLSKPYTRGN